MDDLISRLEAIAALGKHPEFKVRLFGKSYDEGRSDQWFKDVYKLTTVPSAQQWIPCSERLPEKDGEYLVTMLYFGEKTVALDWFSHYETDDEDNGKPLWVYGYDNVIAWMPRPEAWKGDKHEAE